MRFPAATAKPVKLERIVRDQKILAVLGQKRLYRRFLIRHIKNPLAAATAPVTVGCHIVVKAIGTIEDAYLFDLTV